jgi:opacity protein-like surface antigen
MVMSTSRIALSGIVAALGTIAAVSAANAGGDVIDYGAGMRRAGAAVPVPAPIPVPETQTGYYVRIDAAYSMSDTSKYKGTDPRADMVRGDSYLDNFPRFGLGVGYQFNKWFRMDATYDIRDNVKSRGAGSVDYTIPNVGGTNPTIAMRDTFTDSFTSTNATGLINAYLDAPVSKSFTPYVGVGIGFVRHQLKGRYFTRTTNCVDALDCDPATAGDQAGSTVDSTASAIAGQNNIALAAAAMAGFTYQVWDNTKLDLGYRYLHLQGVTVTGRSTNVVENLKIPDQGIHELRVGVRYDIN